MSDTIIKKLEKNDVVNMIEWKIGKPVKDISMHNAEFNTAKCKNTESGALEDTHPLMSVSNAKYLMKKLGFTEAFSKQYKFYSDAVFDEESIWYRPDGLVIYMDTYKSMANDITLVGEVYVDCEFWKGYEMLSHIACGGGTYSYFGDSKKSTMAKFSVCATKYLVKKLDIIKNLGTLIPQWREEDKFIWFLNSDEARTYSGNCRQLSLQKVKESNNPILLRIMEKYID